MHICSYPSEHGPSWLLFSVVVVEQKVCVLDLNSLASTLQVTLKPFFNLPFIDTKIFESVETQIIP